MSGICSEPFSSKAIVRYVNCYSWVNHKGSEYWAVTQTDAWWYMSLHVSLLEVRGSDYRWRLKTNKRSRVTSDELYTANVDISKLGIDKSNLEAEGYYKCK